jgi:hypothetical protein
MKFVMAVATGTLLGCSGKDQSTTDSPTVVIDARADAPKNIDAPLSDFTTLISRDWSLGPGQEVYRCKRIRVPVDSYITTFRNLGPRGTHHTVLTTSATSSPLGDYDCNAANLDFQMLYAAGLGTDDLKFPDGVAIKLTAGQYININLHLFNTGDSILSGTSGVQIKTIPLAQVTTQAEMIFGGQFNLSIPSQVQPTLQTGTCTARAPFNIFAVWPHMHQTATHQKVVLTHGAAAPQTLIDDDYSFSEQRNYVMPTPVAVAAGDKISVTCTYVNQTGSPIMFGDSSSAEMCFGGMYRYPALPNSSLFECTEGRPR